MQFLLSNMDNVGYKTIIQKYFDYTFNSDSLLETDASFFEVPLFF